MHRSKLALLMWVICQFQCYVLHYLHSRWQCVNICGYELPAVVVCALYMIVNAVKFGSYPIFHNFWHADKQRILSGKYTEPELKLVFSMAAIISLANVVPLGSTLRRVNSVDVHSRIIGVIKLLGQKMFAVIKVCMACKCSSICCLYSSDNWQL